MLLLIFVDSIYGKFLLGYAQANPKINNSQSSFNFF